MTTPNASPSSHLIFWDPSGYRFNSNADWNQWRYIPDGLGGQIGIRYSVNSGFNTWDWDSFSGKAPVGSIADKFGTCSFGKNQQVGLATTSVNAVRMQTNTKFIGAHHNYVIELDFSQYKGSRAGGVDGVAGLNTFFGVSDIYAGLTYAKTVVTVTSTLASGGPGSPGGWTLVNGGAVPPAAAGGQPSAQLSLINGVLQGTNTPAPGGIRNSVDTVMGLVCLDAAGYRTLRLSYDIYPVGNNRSPRTDNSALYVATRLPAEPVKVVPPAPVPEPVAPPAPEPVAPPVPEPEPEPEPEKVAPPVPEPEPEPEKVAPPAPAPEPEPEKVTPPAPEPVPEPVVPPAKECDLPEGAAPVKPSVSITDSQGKGPGTSTSYTFVVRNPDGSVAGKGCFTYETPADGGEPKLSAFYYHDKTAGTITQGDVRTFFFNQSDKGTPRFTFVARTPAKGVCSLTADTTLPTNLTAIGGEGPQFYLGKTLDFPVMAKGTTVTEETNAVPAVDLVVVIDSSVSMKDEAIALSEAVAAAIESAKTKCPSDLRVTYLGIEGTFKNTRFDTTLKKYLVATAKADETALRGRQKGTVADGGAQEDGARAIEDAAAHFDWRPDARRAIFFLGDEAFEGGGLDVDQEDRDAADRSIAAAKTAEVRVHTYLGTSSAKEKQRLPLEAEYARVASETGGKAFTSRDALNGFQALLEQVICGSKTSKSTTTEFCCCQQYVEQP